MTLVKNLFILFGIVLIAGCNSTDLSSKAKPLQLTKAEYAIVIHGGAGSMRKGMYTDGQEQEYLTMLEETVLYGQELLKKGTDAITVVEKVITRMENSPLFNSGVGAVFTHNGENELDASIMDGKTLMAGAVGGVKTIKNPIIAARAVMEKSDHVLLVGLGAQEFAKNIGLEMVENAHFFTQPNYDRLQKILTEEKGSGSISDEYIDRKYGTVGAAVLDKSGNLAAGTSTGGMTNKRYNRIGDSPIIGAGTYADNATCAVSCTGHGEFFIRKAVAHSISAGMMYGNRSLEDISNEMIHKTLMDMGGAGGLIAVDHMGNISMPYNTAGMFRAFARPDSVYIGIY